jgi:acyl carrier protein
MKGTGMSTLEIVQDILTTKFNLDRAKLTPEAELSRLDIDSLAVLELLFDIEDRFGLKIKDDVPSSLLTLQDVVVYIDGLLNQRRAQETAVALSPPE